MISMYVYDILISFLESFFLSMYIVHFTIHLNENKERMPTT